MALNLGSMFFQLGVNTSGLNRASSDVKRFSDISSKNLDRTSRAASNLGRTLLTVVSVETTRRTLMLADSYQGLEDRMRMATNGAMEFNNTMTSINRTAFQTGASFESIGGAFQRLSFIKDSVQGTNQEMLTLVDSISKLGIVSNASQQELNTALIQFSQGLAGGKFQAQELQSILEAVPAIGVQIAKGMGISLSRFIELKKEGELLSSDVFEALLSQTDEINNSFEKMPVRLGRATGILSNSFARAVEKTDDMFNVTTSVARVILLMADGVSQLPTIIAKGTLRFNEMLAGAQRIFSIMDNLSISFNANLLIGIEKVNLALAKTGSFIDRIFNRGRRSTEFEESIKSIEKRILELKIDKLQKFQENNVKTSKTIVDTEQRRLEILKQIADIENQMNAVRQGAIEIVGPEQPSPTQANDPALRNAALRGIGLENIAKMTNSELMKIATSSDETMIEQQGKTFRKMLSNASSHSKRLFEINKAFQLAEAAVNAPSAVLGAFNFGSKIGGPILGGVFAATAAAAAAVQIAAISSASFSGARQTGGVVNPGRLARVNESGPEVFSVGGKDFLLSGNQGGIVTPNNRLGGSPVMIKNNINIIQSQGVETTVTESQNDTGGVDFNVLVQKIDQAQAAGLRDGTSKLSSAIQGTFKLNRAAGAFV